MLGPNGAGKTTTIKMLTTMLGKTSGAAYVGGFDITTQPGDVRKNIGIVFQDPSLDDKLTGRENLELHAMLYKMGRDEQKRTIDEVIKFVELEDKQHILIENYSGGMKRRLEIGRGIIHEPAVLFLDEPTIGLDAQTRRKIWEYLKRLNKEKRITIVLTTHYIEEADALCDRVAFIDHGKIIKLGTPEALKHSIGGDVVSLEINGDANRAKRILKSVNGVKSIAVRAKSLDVSVENGEKHIAEIVTSISNNGIGVTAVNLHKPSLEDVFIKYTGKKIREEEGEGSKALMRTFARRG